MATTASITISKMFTYRGEREQFDNTHHLDTVPSTPGQWNTLGTAIQDLEKRFLTADTSLVNIVGHEPGNPAAVFESPAIDGGINGSLVPATTEHACPGDAAMWVRWGTTQKTSRGKPIYLRSYYHDVFTGVSKDNVAASQFNFLDGLGLALTTGVVASGVTFRRAGPNGAVAQNHMVGTYITTRTLEKRGRRKKPTVNLFAPDWKLPPGDYTIN